MDRIPCPTCGRMKPAMAIRDGRCRDDIMDEQRTQLQPVAIAWNDIRAERNKRLAACDWTQAPDADLTQQERNAWIAFRQALRDLPETYPSPTQVEWPTPPQ